MAKEFREEEHPRDKEGKFTDGVGTKAEQKRLEQMGISSQEKTVHNNLTNEEKRLQELTDGKKESKKKKLAKKIANFQPIQFQIQGKEMQCEFDMLGANKNIQAKGNSDKEGYKFKQANLKRLEEFIREAKYSHSKKEEGKNNPAHRGVQEWHYLKNTIDTEKGKFDIFINVRDKGEKKYIYEISFRKRKK